MSLEELAMTPECVECGAVWLRVDQERWQLHQVDVDELA
jgi:hypothetical protein